MKTYNVKTNQVPLEGVIGYPTDKAGHYILVKLGARYKSPSGKPILAKTCFGFISLRCPTDRKPVFVTESKIASIRAAIDRPLNGKARKVVWFQEKDWTTFLNLKA